MGKIEDLISEFQCPGCLHGPTAKQGCSKYSLEAGYGFKCQNHVLGTHFLHIGTSIALGLPKGFNRPTIDFSKNPPTSSHTRMEIRIWANGAAPTWDKFNVAVWAMEKDGFLFVRTVSPRVARIYVDVIENGTLAMVPNAIDVSQFYDDID